MFVGVFYFYSMLSALTNLCNRIIALHADKLVRQSLDNSLIQNDILNLNKEQLYEQGVFADGKETGPYSLKTLEYKINEAGKLGNDTRTDHITFNDTGELYGSFKFKNRKKDFIISADTIKDGEDLEKTDGKIVGLTDESLQQIREYILPILQRLFLKEIKG